MADAVRNHLLFNNAQLGAGHELSNRSTATVEAAHDVIKVAVLLCGFDQLPFNVLKFAQTPDQLQLLLIANGYMCTNLCRQS